MPVGAPLPVSSCCFENKEIFFSCLPFKNQWTDGQTDKPKTMDATLCLRETRILGLAACTETGGVVRSKSVFRLVDEHGRGKNGDEQGIEGRVEKVRVEKARWIKG